MEIRELSVFKPPLMLSYGWGLLKLSLAFLITALFSNFGKSAKSLEHLVRDTTLSTEECWLAYLLMKA